MSPENQGQLSLLWILIKDRLFRKKINDHIKGVFKKDREAHIKRFWGFKNGSQPILTYSCFLAGQHSEMNLPIVELLDKYDVQLLALDMEMASPCFTARQCRERVGHPSNILRILL